MSMSCLFFILLRIEVAEILDIVYSLRETNTLFGGWICLLIPAERGKIPSLKHCWLLDPRPPTVPKMSLVFQHTILRNL